MAPTASRSSRAWLPVVREGITAARNSASAVAAWSSLAGMHLSRASVAAFRLTARALGGTMTEAHGSRQTESAGPNCKTTMLTLGHDMGLCGFHDLRVWRSLF